MLLENLRYRLMPKCSISSNLLMQLVINFNNNLKGYGNYVTKKSLT